MSNGEIECETVMLSAAVGCLPTPAPEVLELDEREAVRVVVEAVVGDGDGVGDGDDADMRGL